MNGIEETIQQAVEACELELYGIARSDQGLTVYIDKKTDPVSIEDCEKVMKQISYSENVDHLHIEVSSKGLHPALFTPKHYQTALSKWVSIKTDTQRFKGILVTVSDHTLTLEKGDHSFDIELSAIKSAKQIPVPKGE